MTLKNTKSEPAQTAGNAPELFRSKSIEKWAMQWNGNNLDALRRWGAPVQPLPASDRCLMIGTLEDGPNCEALHVATCGDWIIKGVRNEFYPCKPDVFATSYERVAASSQEAAPPEPMIEVIMPEPLLDLRETAVMYTEQHPDSLSAENCEVLYVEQELRELLKRALAGAAALPSAQNEWISVEHCFSPHYTTPDSSGICLGCKHYVPSKGQFHIPDFHNADCFILRGLPSPPVPSKEPK